MAQWGLGSSLVHLLIWSSLVFSHVMSCSVTTESCPLSTSHPVSCVTHQMDKAVFIKLSLTWPYHFVKNQSPSPGNTEMCCCEFVTWFKWISYFREHIWHICFLLPNTLWEKHNCCLNCYIEWPGVFSLEEVLHVCRLVVEVDGGRAPRNTLWSGWDHSFLLNTVEKNKRFPLPA